MLAINPGYAGQTLRVDLTTGKIATEKLPPVEELKRFVGGTGLGIKILYDEVLPGVGPFDPANRLIFASGPLGGTIGGSGTISLVTKGPMTGGALSSQANGFMGAFMKFAGFDAFIIQGASAKPVYLYVHDGEAELRDASKLKGKDTWETQDLIAEEMGKRTSEVSVMSIGPAGENKVRFAAVAGDYGHVAAHGGPGAAMASKNLKAIAVARGWKRPAVADKEKLNSLAKLILEDVQKVPLNIFQWGTGNTYPIAEKGGWLPIKNYLETTYAEKERFSGPKYRPMFKRQRTPCWGCRFDHVARVTIIEGPYAGFVGDEPEYESFAAFGSLTLQNDPAAAVVLSNEVDRLGMDINETGWIMAWVMECYEKGLITKEDTGGLEMTWGNVEAMRALVRKIAYREGFGNILAEGAMRAAQKFGSEAAKLAIFTGKGNTPRGHDHRIMWHMILDASTADTGTDQAGLTVASPATLGLSLDTDIYTAEGAASMLAAGGGKMPFQDTIGMCRLALIGVPNPRITETLNAATGWNLSEDDVWAIGRRLIHLLRAFNARHGQSPRNDFPSARYASDPASGPAKGNTFLPVFERARRSYYQKMGWDLDTGRPLPETLRKFDLDYVIKDLW